MVTVLYDTIMARRSRIRRIAKWSGVVMCVLLLVASIVSGRGGVGDVNQPGAQRS